MPRLLPTLLLALLLGAYTSFLHAAPVDAGKGADCCLAEIMPGMAVQREVEDFVFYISVGKQQAFANIQVQRAGRILAKTKLTAMDNTLRLDLEDQNTQLQGSLAVNFAYPQQRSNLIADLVIHSKRSQKKRFSAELLAWHSPVAMVMHRMEKWLTPELQVISYVLFDAEQSVRVEFKTGNQTIHTVTLSQGVNSVVIDKSFAIGNVTIAKDASLQMQMATPTQEGSVYLKCEVSSSNVPVTSYAASIATWPYTGPNNEVPQQ